MSMEEEARKLIRERAEDKVAAQGRREAFMQWLGWQVRDFVQAARNMGVPEPSPDGWYIQMQTPWEGDHFTGYTLRVRLNGEWSLDTLSEYALSHLDEPNHREGIRRALIQQLTGG